MRVIVFSDTHGNYYAMEKIMMRNQIADMFVFLGDGESEFNRIRSKYPQKDMKMVSGNCDYGSVAQRTIIFDAGNIRILATHGHYYGVKSGIYTLQKQAEEHDCKVVLFGHTHQRFELYEDGIYYLNPGSAACPRDFNEPSFGYVDITSSGIVTNIVDI